MLPVRAGRDALAANDYLVPAVVVGGTDLPVVGAVVRTDEEHPTDRCGKPTSLSIAKTHSRIPLASVCNFPLPEAINNSPRRGESPSQRYSFAVIIVLCAVAQIDSPPAPLQ